jgi:hypothetical protein
MSMPGTCLHGIVLEETYRVAENLGLPPWWLNEQASVYTSGKDDPGNATRSIIRAGGDGSSPEHVLPKKALLMDKCR